MSTNGPSVKNARFMLLVSLMTAVWVTIPLAQVSTVESDETPGSRHATFRFASSPGVEAVESWTISLELSQRGNKFGAVEALVVPPIRLEPDLNQKVQRMLAQGLSVTQYSYFWSVAAATISNSSVSSSRKSTIVKNMLTK